VSRSDGKPFYDKGGVAHNTASFAKKRDKNRAKKKAAKNRRGGNEVSP
jgi:hypothetical protein